VFVELGVVACVALEGPYYQGGVGLAHCLQVLLESSLRSARPEFLEGLVLFWGGTIAGRLVLANVLLGRPGDAPRPVLVERHVYDCRTGLGCWGMNLSLDTLQ
jgi:hypothetical protein